MSISGLREGVKIWSWNNDSIILDPKYEKASLMPKMALKEARYDFLCYIQYSGCHSVRCQFRVSRKDKDMIMEQWQHNFNPKYHTEHDGKLHNATKGFVNGQKLLFVLYSSEYHSEVSISGLHEGVKI